MDGHTYVSFFLSVYTHTDTDGCYVMTEANIEESGQKVDQFISDTRTLSESRKKTKHSNWKL